MKSNVQMIKDVMLLGSAHPDTNVLQCIHGINQGLLHSGRFLGLFFLQSFGGCQVHIVKWKPGTFWMKV